MQPTKEQVAARRRAFPMGCRVVLIQMDDAHAPPAGTQGVVDHVDDTGTVHIRWDSGSCLGAVYGVDTIEQLDQEGEHTHGKM